MLEAPGGGSHAERQREANDSAWRCTILSDRIGDCSEICVAFNGLIILLILILSGIEERRNDMENSNTRGISNKYQKYQVQHKENQ